MTTAPLPITGYVERWSAHPGEALAFHISCETSDYTIELRRLIHGDPSPRGPGVKEEVIAHPLNGQSFTGGVQSLSLGSCVQVPHLPASDAVAIIGSVKASLIDAAPQALIALDHGGQSLAVVLDRGRIALQADSTTPSPPSAAIRQGDWYDFQFIADHAAGRACFRYRPHAFTPLAPDGETLTLTLPEPKATDTASLLFAARAAIKNGAQWQVAMPFNGRLADLKMFAGPDAVATIERSWQAREMPSIAPAADWSFVGDAESERVPDSTGRYDGHSINRPTRLVTGPDYFGETRSPFERPDLYNAAHFHDDDLADAGWPVSLTLPLPEDLRSGVYALRLRCAKGEDEIPFLITPRPGAEAAAVAVLIPTISYQIYANMHADASLLPEAIVPLADRTPDWTPGEAYVRAHRLYSCYDSHSDGSGICMSTLARPMPIFVRSGSTSRLNAAPHQFSSDLFLIDWLEEKGITYEIVTDHDLHARGSDALTPYNVILSGTHAEYWTSRMLDSLWDYQQAGGRFMCLSGNSLYWATGLSEDGKIVEVRRNHGLRSWTAEPGEAYISLTGTEGGIWRHLGRAPQKYIGVGMAAMGFDNGRPYKRTEASYASRAAFLFDGISEENIGDFPSLVSEYGAAGYEIDRADFSLGTPGHAVILASATDFPNAYQLVIDEVISTSPYFGGEYQPNVRADIVFYETPNNGAVFTTGSISWCAALSHNGYRNSVSQLTENVVRCFMRDRTLPLGAANTG